MNVELYNKTAMVKEVPKYGYNGKIKINPGETHPIKDYMIAFYRPYAKIGVVVRGVLNKEDAETVVTPDVEDVEVNNQITEHVVEEASESHDESDGTVEGNNGTVEVVSESAEEVIEEEAVTTVKYLEKDLLELKLDELKKIAKEIGADVDDSVRKKATVIEAILKKQGE